MSPFHPNLPPAYRAQPPSIFVIGTMDREELNALRSERLGIPVDEAEHFYVCKACGQAVDKRRLGDVFHHEEIGHQPIPTNA